MTTENVAAAQPAQPSTASPPPYDPDHQLHLQVEEWFTYHRPNETQTNALIEIRNTARGFAHDIVRLCPPGPDRSAALRLLREAVMTANASIVVPTVPQRGS